MSRITSILFALLAVNALSAAVKPPAPPKPDAATKEEAEFRRNLVTMMQRSDRSEKLLRQQITESQNAPFLPDLYLQLAQLLSEKSNTLYYLQMERQKGADAVLSDKEASPVIAAQKEAIAVYRLVLKDFPKFEKRRQVLYRLSMALKSIDEATEFVKVSGQILAEYPQSDEATGARLMLGQHFFEKQMYPDALQMIDPVTKTKSPYERNLARYRTGLIYIAQEKFKEALGEFELVVGDAELKEQDNPYNTTIKQKRSKSDLKREALIDSIRAYTRVYEKDPEPVAYYSRLAPTEFHFQEVIEKLSIRYITLKKYDTAIRLLRTLTERIVEPQKVVNIYHDVLLMIPIQDRVHIPVEEMRFLLEKYNLWTAYYDIPPQSLGVSFAFFEKQVRDLATSSHTLAKEEKNPERKGPLLKRARDYYLLYLAFFRKTGYASKMATNLADVYFAQQDFPKSGDYYLRVFSEEFGKVPDKKLLIENAILCLQKKGEYSFYDNLRLRGLLIKSLESYMAFDKKMKKDPAMNFLLVKTQYEQGFFPEAIGKLAQFIKAFPKDSRAVDAGELILDYYNTKNDYTELESWSKRLLALKLPHPTFNEKLVRINTQAKSKSIHEKIRSLANYDDFAQGKSYLSMALNSGNAELKDFALKEALAKSKREQDIQTFLKAASIMADKETNQDKKAEILKSVAQEQIKVTQFYKALGTFRRLHSDTRLKEATRVAILEESVSVALLLRDWKMLGTLFRNPMWGKISDGARTRVREQISDLLESPVHADGEMINALFKIGLTDAALLSLFKAQYRVSPEMHAKILALVTERCGKEGKQAFCAWTRLEAQEVPRKKFIESLKAAPATMAGIQAMAPRLMTVTNDYHSLENSGDAHLETAVALKESEVYTAFGQYLGKAAAANPDLKAVLQQKAQETLSSAQLYRDKCRLISEKSSSINPAAKFCTGGASPGVKELLSWAPWGGKAMVSSDPQSDKIDGYQKAIFAGADATEALLSLSREYLDKEYFRHASAAAAYGMSLFKSREKDFRAVLGCSVLGQGFYSEANYHLKNANSVDGIREKCQKELDGKLKDLS